jgi:hypothetical protein
MNLIKLCICLFFPLLALQAQKIGDHYNVLLSSEYTDLKLLIKHSLPDSLLTDKSGVSLVYLTNSSDISGEKPIFFEGDYYTGLERKMTKGGRLERISLIFKGFIVGEILYRNETITNSLHLTPQSIRFYNIPFVFEALNFDFKEMSNLSSHMYDRSGEFDYMFLLSQIADKNKSFCNYVFDQNGKVIKMDSIHIDNTYFSILEQNKEIFNSFGKISNFQIENYKKLEDKKLLILTTKFRNVNKKLKDVKLKNDEIEKYIFTDQTIYFKNSEGRLIDLLVYSGKKSASSDKNAYRAIASDMNYFEQVTDNDRRYLLDSLTRLNEDYFKSESILNNLKFRDYIGIHSDVFLGDDQILSLKVTGYGELDGPVSAMNQKGQTIWRITFNRNVPFGTWVYYDNINQVKKAIREFTVSGKPIDKGDCKSFDNLPDMSQLISTFFDLKYLGKTEIIFNEQVGTTIRSFMHLFKVDNL